MLTRLWLFSCLVGCGIPTAALEAEPAGSTAPILVEEGLWTWVPYADAFCADGTTTGMAVNTQRSSHDVVIYLQGGGACWDGDKCRPHVSTALHLGGYQYGNFKREDNLWSIPPISRNDDENPFRDMNLVFVPYCTGDLHAGLGEHTYSPTIGRAYTTLHVGGLNLDAFLRRLVPTFPDAQRVFLVGASAGGLGTMLNLGRVANAFPSAQLFVVDDSGPPIDVDNDVVQRWTDAWGPIFPTECGDCAQHPSSLVSHWASVAPDARVALLTHETDTVLAYYLDESRRQITDDVARLMDTFESFPQHHVYVKHGAGHVVMADRYSKADGLTFQAWLKELVDGSADWRSVGR